MPMDSACGNAALPALGFPIRESTDHRLFSAYPWLIAAVHALHRLLVPRHPPCALPILTVIRPLHIANALARLARSGPVIPVGAHACAKAPVGNSVQFSRSAWRRAPGLGARSLKTQQHAAHPRTSVPPGPVDVSVAARAGAGTECAGRRATAPILELP